MSITAIYTRVCHLEQVSNYRHKINNFSTETLSYNEYNELGQLKTKNVGSTASTPLQTVDYRYNIRGWLTDINDVITLGNDLFAFNIGYDNGLTSGGLYNGNISETNWKSSSDNKLRGYHYEYDGLNRLNHANYRLYGISPVDNSISIIHADSYNENNISYDKNGNILSMFRTGDLDSPVFTIPIDDLRYTYDDGNRLLKVEDKSNHPEGFTDGADYDEEYGYDIFGNTIKDLNKRIPQITYNHLNLPKEITFDGTPTQKINYLYNALGQKVEKKVTQAATITTTDYQSGFQYENKVLRFFSTAEGYVNIRANSQNDVTDITYVYNYTDHLGNIRLSYTKGTGTNPPVILEENHYYPFGLKHKKYGMAETVPPLDYQYKYNGKEFQDELGLNWTSMDYRNYDNALGRFHNMDRLAELVPSLNPYRFAFNNPVYWSDPTGLFESESAAMAHIKSYGLQNARAQYNERGYWEVESNDVVLHQSGNDFVLKYLDTSSGAVSVNADGVYTIDEIAVTEQTIKNGVINGVFGEGIERKSSVFGEGLNRSNGFATMLNNPISSCHHTSTFTQGSGMFNLSDNLSGYIQHGGSMRSGFIGSATGKDGVIYGSIENPLAIGGDIKTKIQFLKYIMDVKGGLDIGNAIGEMILKGEDVNIRTYNYTVKEVVKANAGGNHVFNMYRNIKKTGFIINTDTLK